MTGKTAREKSVEITLGYNSLDNGEPSNYCIALLKEYAQGI